MKINEWFTVDLVLWGSTNQHKLRMTMNEKKSHAVFLAAHVECVCLRYSEKRWTRLSNARFHFLFDIFISQLCISFLHIFTKRTQIPKISDLLWTNGNKSIWEYEFCFFPLCVWMCAWKLALLAVRFIDRRRKATVVLLCRVADKVSKHDSSNQKLVGAFDAFTMSGNSIRPMAKCCYVYFYLCPLLNTRCTTSHQIDANDAVVRIVYIHVTRRLWLVKSQLKPDPGLWHAWCSHLFLIKSPDSS